MTVQIYRCTHCGTRQPSPGRLEGNWCPGCKKVGTLALDLPDEAQRLAAAAGGAAGPDRHRADAQGFAPFVEQAIAGNAGALREDLVRLRDRDSVRVLLFLEEEGGSAAIIDVFRACAFRTKTHALRCLLLLRAADLVQALEGDRWVLTKRARDAIEAVRMAAG
ncbi:MAG TPA: hypothetical protein VGR28_15065 [Candidatus Thermoplasmatota archaeon]|nr:hypothetical protein [Candidatus Thermoplasmatota archaeon]